MATLAMNPAVRRTLGFWDSTLGKKVIMAFTGFVLFGFVVGHLVGNLPIFYGVLDPALGREHLHDYAVFLRSLPGLLWTARLVLLGSVLTHIAVCVQLAVRAKQARPVDYVMRKPTKSSYASRTMYWSGPIIGAFIIYHLMHLTFGLGGTTWKELDPYDNVVHGFQNIAVSGFYIVAMTLLCLHLYHGLWSMFQTLGINNGKWNPYFKAFSKVFAFGIAAGNISIPLAVLVGLIKI